MLEIRKFILANNIETSKLKNVTMNYDVISHKMLTTAVTANHPKKSSSPKHIRTYNITSENLHYLKRTFEKGTITANA